MRVICCADPLNRRRVDALYEREAAAAQAAGLEVALLIFEALVDEQDTLAALARIAPAAGHEPAVYRGWMLRPLVYAQLYEALAERHIWLINTPAAYRHCHYLPESYAIIAGMTPRSVWLEAETRMDMERIMAVLHPFGDRPVILKDYVKSRKHEWTQACYIPSAADRSAVERVVARFLALQGADLNEGLVFREYVPFEPLTTHAKSGMPLTKEFRLFWLDGQVVLATPYWEQGEYGELAPPLTQFEDLARQVQSRFFTMDVAKRQSGDWMVVELGDGQVAGLPEQADPQQFYQALAGRLI